MPGHVAEPTADAAVASQPNDVGYKLKSFFRTEPGFSAGPRGGSEMRKAVLGFWSIELLRALVRWDAYTWNHHALVVDLDLVY